MKIIRKRKIKSKEDIKLYKEKIKLRMYYNFTYLANISNNSSG